MKAGRRISALMQRGQKQRDKNQLWFISYGVASNTNVNLVGGVFLSGYLAYIGVGETLNGILMALPVLATVFQPVGAMLCASHGNIKNHVLTYTVLERIFFSALYCVPLLFAGFQAPIVAAIFLLANIGTAIVTPSANEWMMRTVPGKDRHEFFAKREIAFMLGLVLAILAGGYMMDAFKERDMQRQSYFTLAAIIAVLAIVAVVSLIKVARPAAMPPEKPRFSTLLVPLRDKRFMITMVSICMFQFGMQIAGSYWAIYQLNGLGFSYSFVNILSVVGLLLRVFVLRIGTKYLRNRSWSWIFGMSAAVIGLGHFLHTFTAANNAIWYIWLPHFIANAGWSFLNLSMLNYQYDNIDKEDRSIYLAVGAMMTGLMGFMGSLVGGAILEAVNALRASLPWFNLAGQQVQMFVSGLLLIINWLVVRRLCRQEKVR